MRRTAPLEWIEKAEARNIRLLAAEAMPANASTAGARPTTTTWGLGNTGSTYTSRAPSLWHAMGTVTTPSRDNGDSQEHQPASATAPAPGGLPLEQVERQHILSTLKRSGWRIEGPNGAANLLRLNPSTLRSRMKKLGLK